MALQLDSGTTDTLFQGMQLEDNLPITTTATYGTEATYSPLDKVFFEPGTMLMLARSHEMALFAILKKQESERIQLHALVLKLPKPALSRAKEMLEGLFEDYLPPAISMEDATKMFGPQRGRPVSVIKRLK